MCVCVNTTMYLVTMLLDYQSPILTVTFFVEN